MSQRTLEDSSFRQREPKCHLYGLPGCPRNFSPVCGTDGIIYPNECVLCHSNR
uniref:Kazal-like domain-containing protein n=1 Tax=Sphenodon punctatus TaxID=8508 RepID=A0A8D0LCI5_SPHPU